MPSDIQFVTSQLLSAAGTKHGWFTRYGGVSENLFSSLNGKKGSGDVDKNVNQNRERALISLLKSEPKQECDSKLAHIIHQFKSDILVATEPGEYQNFDASVTNKENIVLSQTTADCGTIIIADTVGSVVSVVHGSWHTLSARIICDVVAKIKSYSKNELVAGIGPMICKECYEFGSEATELFEAKYLVAKEEKFLVNLKQMIIDQLQESGVTKIEDVNVCTLEDERFFSHRRSGAHSGRFLTLASLY